MSKTVLEEEGKHCLKVKQLKNEFKVSHCGLSIRRTWHKLFYWDICSAVRGTCGWIIKKVKNNEEHTEEQRKWCSHEIYYIELIKPFKSIHNLLIMCAISFWKQVQDLALLNSFYIINFPYTCGFLISICNFHTHFAQLTALIYNRLEFRLFLAWMNFFCT